MFNMNVIESWQRNTATKEDRLFTGILSGLMLLIGLSIGYWVSETKKASPIVFEGEGALPQVLSDSDIAKLTTATQSTESTQNKITKTTSPTTQSTLSDSFVAALTGTKYYFASCSEVKRIKEENRIFFSSEQEAIDAGYEASSCVLKSR